NRKWGKLKTQSYFIDYLKFICSFASVPNLMVFPAIEELKNRGIIKADAVVIPGHTGDFIVGGHIPKDLLLKENSKSSDIVNSIINKHYSYSPSIPISEEVKKKLIGQVGQINSWSREDKM